MMIALFMSRALLKANTIQNLISSEEGVSVTTVNTRWPVLVQMRAAQQISQAKIEFTDADPPLSRKISCNMEYGIFLTRAR